MTLDGVLYSVVILFGRVILYVWSSPFSSQYFQVVFR